MAHICVKITNNINRQIVMYLVEVQKASTHTGTQQTYGNMQTFNINKALTPINA